MKIAPKYFLLFCFLSISVAIVSISITGHVKETKRAARQAQKVFQEKDKILRDGFFFLQQPNGKSELVGDGVKYKGTSVLLFQSDSLVFWSDNTISTVFVNNPSLFKDGIVVIKHKTYVCVVDTLSTGVAVGLIHLSSHYPYQNQFLKNGMHSDYKQTKGVKVSELETKVCASIKFSDGKHAFYLDYSNIGARDYYALRVVGTLFFFLSIFFLLNYLRLLLKRSQSIKNSKYALVIIAALLLVRIVLIIGGWLSNQFLFFTPFLYASKMAPTYGDLIINTVLLVFFAYLINRFVRLPKRFLVYDFNRTAWVGVLNFFYALVVVYVNASSESLIAHSSINLVVHNMSQLRLPIIIGYTVLAFNYLSLVLVAYWICNTLKQVKGYKLCINAGAMLALLLLLSYAFKAPMDLYAVVFCYLIYLFTILLSGWIHNKPILTTLAYFLMVFSIFIMVFMVNLTQKKEYQQNQSLAISLSTEHDPIAEYFFKELGAAIKSDTAISNRLEPESFNQEELSWYMAKKYFNAYWKKYELTITVCGDADSVLVNDTELYWYPCYSFFNEYVNERGVQIPETDFYYIDKFTGLINYLGWMKIKLKDGSEVSLFVELDSRLTTKSLGYPELLLDEGVQAHDESVKHSYAKYYQGNLIAHTGKYEYSLISDVFEHTGAQDFKEVKHNGYVHLVYAAGDENLIVISKPIVRFIDYLVLFSYVFVYYYLSSLVIALLFVSSYRKVNFRDSLRNKIQFSVIAILLMSLLLIAGSTTWFNVRKYNQTQFRIVEEKINSVYVELEHKLAFEEELTPNWSAGKYDNLDQLLIKFSDVFYSDINLYSPNGELLATSRSEVFDLGLQSRRMDPLAYHKMNNERLARYIHKERINNLAYLSAYIPFMNNQGELLAYLNLPYFTKQKELQEDITTITVAIVNIYVLLILLTIVIAVFISDQITKPLEMIQAKFRELKLGSRYEPIEYKKNDEIGRLVVEYNRMVQELERNVDLLAKSERESAWREMAKQVAHEIKNPLTPMRLSVQQLKRTWDDKKDGFEIYLNRVTETLIEQIDNLSHIAGEFSNFAKMPVAKIQRVNLYDALNASCDLFKANEGVRIRFTASVSEAWVMADADQLTRVFINIVKNGIQSIPDGRKGEVIVTLDVSKKVATVEVSDNGKGVPEEIVGRLFTPNFTTKTSGMGLGLAIVKNILESVDGTITLSTELDKGTTFTVCLPVVK